MAKKVHSYSQPIVDPKRVLGKVVKILENGRGNLTLQVKLLPWVVQSLMWNKGDQIKPDVILKVSNPPNDPRIQEGKDVEAVVVARIDGGGRFRASTVQPVTLKCA